ncbi:5'/3'-nucleotidase SurE [Clostridium sp. CM028]|uniref:5'/3'-nucleotidase SurE n=1 Tax=unclassified Clostridium TaxID=2614128 RepID=UPI001C0D6CBC|nr:MULTISPECIES: 5'/3'-nucleotidase SurE [unclassified Clostridium]MBU3090908.1 5'/3'-nucleotidase SurE [Clostridium sp. CF011]MBW9144524.1 5'/3'-nucleotidase SurE [Clostridium sp. CM027]MBW9147946.1 5'/3'-nucleotidase SurE [Clostridium sp. CM028]UVE40708.1 5'/3'-nucleotidase SurE [Clostridium sp. CM027]WAG69676.1 5'/3'-nucleotidase SurE [Clostridium sp. CF011]
MRLLLTNDDGINAKGLYALAKELEKNHEVIIVAPYNEKSACGHSITLTRPLIVRETKIEGLKSKAYSVDGTPADCVKIAINKLIDSKSDCKIDMVVSGINKGLNLGTDVLYSGTVSAAIEATIYKIPAMAVSMEIKRNIENYEMAAKYAGKILLKAIENNIKNDIVLNVNIPMLRDNEIKGIKVCKIGSRLYNNRYIETIGENNETQYEIKGEVIDIHEDDSDTIYFKEGYVTVTPLHYDLTNFKMLDETRKWF